MDPPHLRHRQTLLTALALDLDAGQELVDLLLDGAEAYHLVEFVEHLVGAADGCDQVYVQPAPDRIALPDRDQSESGGIVAEPHRHIGHCDAGYHDHEHGTERERVRPGQCAERAGFRIDKFQLVATAATTMATHMVARPSDCCGRSFSLPAIPDQGVELTR